MATKRNAPQGTGNRTFSASAPKAVARDPVSSPPAKKSVTHDMIAKRAYELYLARGRVEGFATQDWQRAERELRQGAV